ncbi:hypothetical protein [Deinococcus misasensis]|uniref:hypothetical protein n=1 Tax=Deinococcus misasensis TaxID=392413 RepID=UPI00054FCA7A|nr:hypothetical protein [Deinococcus misasensis]
MLTRSQTLEHLRLAESNGPIYAEHHDLKALQELQVSVVRLCKPFQHDPVVVKRGGQILSGLMRLHGRALVRFQRWLHA